MSAVPFRLVAGVLYFQPFLWSVHPYLQCLTNLTLVGIFALCLLCLLTLVSAVAWEGFSFDSLPLPLLVHLPSLVGSCWSPAWKGASLGHPVMLMEVGESADSTKYVVNPVALHGSL